MIITVKVNYIHILIVILTFFYINVDIILIRFFFLSLKFEREKCLYN